MSFAASPACSTTVAGLVRCVPTRRTARIEPRVLLDREYRIRDDHCCEPFSKPTACDHSTSRLLASHPIGIGMLDSRLLN